MSDHSDAIAHLRSADPRLAAVIDRVGDCVFQPRADGTHFAAIARAIVYQQLSGKAAGTIHRRFEELYGGRSPTPAELLATPDEALRAVGLSRQKSAYLKDLAAKAASGVVPVDDLHELDDDALIDAITAVKGVGRWTAQMFLMFRLGRPDVLPDLDLGIQKGIQRAYRMRSLPKPQRVLEVGRRWAPYRTIACWYLWRSLDNGDGQGPAAKRVTVSKAKGKPTRSPTKRAGVRSSTVKKKSSRTSAAKKRARSR